MEKETNDLICVIKVVNMGLYREQTIKTMIKKSSKSSNNERLRESPSRGAK